MTPTRPLRHETTRRLLVLAGGRPDPRRKPLDPRIVRAAEVEIAARKAGGEWRKAA